MFSKHASSKHIKSSAESLVAASAGLLNRLWGESRAKDLALELFITAVLRRSRLLDLVLIVALLYLVRLAATGSRQGVMRCKKRAFLTCLILALKFLQDRSFSMALWSVVLGLGARELVRHETQALGLLEYNLYVGKDEFKVWRGRLNRVGGDSVLTAEVRLLTVKS